MTSHAITVGALVLALSSPAAAKPAPAAKKSAAKAPAKAAAKPAAKAAVKTPTAAELLAAASAKTPLPDDGSDGLIIPVEGITAEGLVDTFTASRSGGRSHNAIDILAERNTPVLAAGAGKIIKLHLSVRGGISLYQLSADGKYIYYYAHLDHYADGIEEGKEIARGEVIAYVGDTGNAQPGNYHLHFGVYRTQNPKRYWDGEALNPYPLLIKTK
jgi:peptidoglycan LD-endopeptidase LytH